MCASYGCSADTDEEVVDWMCYRVTQSDATTTFEPDAPMTTGQSWSFNERPILEQLYGPCGGDCCIPPGGHQPVNNIGPGCDSGLIVIAIHVDTANDDDGCRPGHCDFGRRADGWCSPPADADPSIVYIVGSAADENDGTMRFRVQLSHASAQVSTVTATTRDGTAVAGNDYTSTTRQVTIPAGQRIQYVDVPIVNDACCEKGRVRVGLRGSNMWTCRSSTTPTMRTKKRS